MEISIDLNSQTPVYIQLIDQVKTGVQLRKLKPGDQMPSIRQLATDLGINHNTVAKAFRLLERDSVIETRGYRGSYVHAHARKNSRTDLNDWMHMQLGNTISELREAGLTDSEIRNAFSDLMSKRTG